MLRWGGVEVSAGFLLTAAVLFYFDTDGFLLWVTLACGLHELGHCAATFLLGGRILRFRLTAVGGELVLDRSNPLSYGGELCAVLAGPAVNLTLAFLAARLGRGEGTWLFAGLNLALGCFNLLPIWPLDGGRALALLLAALRAGPGWRGLAKVCSILCAAALLLAGGGIFWRTGYNFTLFAVALWLTVGLAREEGLGARLAHRRERNRR